MAANDRIRRGDGELVGPASLGEPAAAAEPATTGGRPRFPAPPPPATRVRPPTSWLRGR
ncbi:MAG TPA: hypothetical protein VK607_23365 [Kofleriaceae bacterium]|nr:hypothetical protein [Kofleriaceae bacterium]HMG54626.1 hypothetical protein [Kofleriaceae bacterium]